MSLDFTLVAYYGEKPPALSGLLSVLQTELINLLGDAYNACEIEQIHGTIVGLEGCRSRSGIQNANLCGAGDKNSCMELEGLFDFLLKTPLLPMQVRFGGYSKDMEYPFKSRGYQPYIRTFGLHDQSAVLIGWPAESDIFPMSLDSLRRECIKYHVMHKYHAQPADVDNDLFMVIGQIDHGMANRELLDAAQSRLRSLLSEQRPVDIELGIANLAIVGYRDTRLPPSSCLRYTIEEAMMKIERIKQLYRAW